MILGLTLSLVIGAAICTGSLIMVGDKLRHMEPMEPIFVQKKIERRPNTPVKPVIGTVPADVKIVNEVICECFSGRRVLPNPFTEFHCVGLNDLRFPKDFQVQAEAQGDPLLAAYIAKPKNLRMDDLCLFKASGKPYWVTEYYYNNKQAPFKCRFLIHLEAADAASTRVEILEFEPSIEVGAYASALSGSPGEIHWVEQTTKDRLDLLNIIEEAVQRRLDGK
jgi:hypothetical protein